MSEKFVFKPDSQLNPVPLVMVSCGNTLAEYNIITVAWTGIINSDPAMTYVSIRPNCHSHQIISRNKKFVVNLVDENIVEAADYCGIKSGKDVDKFKATKLTPEKASIIEAPMIKESPLSLECRVKEILNLGSHDMFITEIVAINVNKAFVNKNGKIDLSGAKLVCYSNRSYYRLKEKPLGTFGYTVASDKKI